jgi:hypothetical protein
MNYRRYRVLMTISALALGQITQITISSPFALASAASGLDLTAMGNTAVRAAAGKAMPIADRPPISSPSLGGWRLVRTTYPDGRDEAVSIMHTADALRSDPDFAGLTVLCGQHGLEILVILIEPFPPRSRPSITLGAAKNEIHFEASVVPPGAAILLPDDAVALAKGPWQTLQELPITVELGKTTIRGVVPLSGLGAALQTLMAGCLAR